MLIAALVIAAAAALAVVLIARQHESGQAPLRIGSVPAPHADDAACAALIAALPDQLGDYQRTPAADPAPVGTAAWRADTRTEPVIMRCGLDRPLDFVVGAPLQLVDEVSWFRVADASGDGRVTWFAVDRPVYIALTLPPGSGPTPIQELSEAITDTMPAQAIDPAPPR